MSRDLTRKARSDASAGAALWVFMFVATIVCLLARPVAAEVFSPKTATLDNGLKVIVVENHRAPIVTHMVWYKVGAADEPKGKSGLAHFLEHLMFKGTPSVPSGKFSQIVARNGGNDNAFTNFDYTAYYQRIAADRLPLVMKLEADRMVNLRLSHKDIDSERQVVLEERRMRVENQPSSQLQEKAMAALFTKTPYGIPVIGWDREIRKLSRKDIVSFYRRHYAPNNAIVVIAGDVTMDQVLPLAKKYYGVVPRHDVPSRTRPTEPPHKAPKVVSLRDERVGQPNWSRTYIAPSYHAGRTRYAYALQLLSEILGDGSTSRLYRSLVIDQKLAAGAGAWYEPDRLGRSTFGVYATPREGVSLDRIAAAIDEELHKLLAKGITRDELETAKRRMRAAAIYARDDLGTAPRVIGERLTTGGTVADVEAWPDRIAAVTVDQVDAAAHAVLVLNESVTARLMQPKSGRTVPATRSGAPVTPGSSSKTN